jgi:beta-lactam-binding protein with PASTA domain
MNMKTLFGKIFNRFLVWNLVAMAIVVILLCVGTKYALDIYTHHGEGIVVPELKGMTFEKAYRLLEENKLTIVVSDSGYNKKLPADCILAQTPNHGQKVKEGHVVYVTVNSPSSPTFAIPDIVDNSSVREAEARLMAMGFQLTPTQLVDGEKDWVYGILCRGRRVSNGDRVPIDYPLTLMVGKGTIDDSEDIEYIDPAYPDGIGEVDEFEEVKEPPIAQ